MKCDIMAAGDFVAYYRVSTTKQGQSGLGLGAQRTAVTAYLNGGKWRVVGEFTEIESGRSSERPELARALAMARLRRVPIVVANVSRLTRSLAFLSKLLEAGVDVRFCDLPQIEGATGRFMLQQMASVAELEAGMIGERTRKALAEAKARGVKLGGLRANAKLTDEQRAQGRAAMASRAEARSADLAPILAELRTEGVTTLAALADALNDRGIPAARGGAWSPMQVSRIMKAAA